MPKCPNCKAEIDTLNYVETGQLVYEKGSSLEWIKDDNPDIETSCPECGEKVCLDLLED